MTTNNFFDLTGMVAAIAPHIKPIIVDAVAEALKAQSDNEFAHLDERLSREELCSRWHISKATLHNYINNGKIAPIHIGRRVVFSMGDILHAEKTGLMRYGR